MFTEEELYNLLEEAFEYGYDSALDEILDEESSYNLESEMDAYSESLNAEDKDKVRFMDKVAKKHLPAEARRNMLRGMVASHSPYFKKRSIDVEYDDADMIKNGYKRNPDESDSNGWIDERGRKISRVTTTVNPVAKKYESRMKEFAKKNPKATGKFTGKLMEKLMKKHPEWIKKL